MSTSDELKNLLQTALGGGISEADIADAVAASGYPLQCVVARILRKHLSVQEEWGFLDAEEEVARSIDLIAQLSLWDYKRDQPYARPELALIVECKRSELPYVFFLTDEKPWTPRFPLIAGLKKDEIVVSTDDDRSTWCYRTIKVLGLESHSFLRDGVTFATTFSRCERQGSKLRLSGSEPYNSIVQPLVKALEHFRQVEAPPNTAVYFDVHAAVGIAVIDAPMVGVKVLDNGNSLTTLPWVRLAMHRGIKAQSIDHRQNVFAIDVVHVSFLEAYLTEHLLPFAKEFAQKVMRHHIELSEGKGFVPGMGKNWHRDVESRLVPRGVKAMAKRASAAARQISKSVAKNGGKKKYEEKRNRKD